MRFMEAKSCLWRQNFVHHTVRKFNLICQSNVVRKKVDIFVI